jgi:hypothetical protein
MMTIGKSHGNVALMNRPLRHALQRPLANYNQNNLTHYNIIDVTRIICNSDANSRFLNTVSFFTLLTPCIFVILNYVILRYK